MAVTLPGTGYNYTDLRYTGVLENNVPVADDAGGFTDGWTTVVTTRVGLEKLSGSLRNADGSIRVDKNYNLTCRYQDAIVINSTSRWRIGSAVYKVHDWEKTDQKPHFYIFKVTEENA